MIKKYLKISLVVLMFVVLNMSSSFASQRPTFTSLDSAKVYINQMIIDGEAEFDFYLSNKEDIVKVVDSKAQLLWDIFEELIEKHDYRRYNYTNAYYGYNGTTKNLLIEYKVTYRTTVLEDGYMSDEVDKILRDIIKPGMTEVEKVTAVNDFIVLNTEYSFDSQGSPYSAFAVLLEGKGVCNGYALLGNIMFDKLGIQNRIVDGVITGGELHAWNLVNINNEWYHIDITHNDPVPNRPGVTSHEYLLKDDAFMKQTRTWNYNKYPKAINPSFDHLKNFVKAEKSVETKPIKQENPVTVTISKLESLSDRTYSEWAVPELTKAVEKELFTTRVLNKMKDGITREEFAELIMKLYYALGGNQPKTISTSFIDTFNTAVKEANALGIIQGVSSTQFNPNSLVTREQMAVMFTRLFNVLEIYPITTMEYRYFADESEISDWAKNSIQLTNKLNILQGVGNDKINPKGNASKEQAIALIVRVFEHFSR